MKSFHGHGNTTQHNLPRESEQRFWPRPRQKATKCSNPKRRAAFGKALPIDRRSLARLCQTTAGSLPGPAKRPSVIGKPPKSEKLKTIRKVRPVFAVTGKQPLHVNRKIENKIVPMLKLIDRFWRRIERDRRSSFPKLLLHSVQATGAHGADRFVAASFFTQNPPTLYVTTTPSGRRCAASWAGPGNKVTYPTRNNL